MGVWGTLLVFEVYSTYSRLGIVNGMNRELPFALGSGDLTSAKHFASTSLFFTVINTFSVSVIFIAIFCFSEPSNDYIFPFIVLLIRIVSNSYTSYISGTFRSNNSFNFLSNIQFAILFLKLISSPLILLGFEGFLIWELFLYLTNTILLHLYRPIKVKPSFNVIYFKKLIGIGLPIFFFSTIISTIDTFPRLYIVNYGTEIDLGYYSPVYFMLSTIALLPNQLTSYFYPKFSFELANTSSTKKIINLLKRLGLYSTGIITLIALFIFFSSDKVISFFPKYTDSLPYIKLALLASPFILFKLSHTISAVFKDFKTMAYFTILYFFIQVASLYFLRTVVDDVVTNAILSQIITYALLAFLSVVIIHSTIKKYKAK